MPVPILKQADVLIAQIQAALSDQDLIQLHDELTKRVGRQRARGVLLDVTALDVLDSFASRTIRGIAYAAKLRGAETVVVGIQPDVAYAMVQLGLDLERIETALDLESVATALDLEEGLALLEQRMLRRSRRGS